MVWCSRTVRLGETTRPQTYRWLATIVVRRSRREKKGKAGQGEAKAQRTC